MFFGYPPQAVVENWFHEALFEMLDTIHSEVIAGRTPTAWPGIIPSNHRAALRKKVGLRDRVSAYCIAFSSLPTEGRVLVHDALSDQNRLAELFDGRRDCSTLDELPQEIQAAAKDLFEFAFGLLVNLEIRDVHYATIHEALADKLCPFCGVNGFDAPGAKREDYDHYLPESKYPFAGINLRNLVPMCKKCNSLYKQAADPLWDGNRRRKAVNPYDHTGFEIDLTASVPFAGAKPNIPQWVITFAPAKEEAETWDQVFSIRERLGRDVFDCSYTTWIKDFASWCKAAPRTVQARADVLPALNAYERYLSQLGRQDRSFLRLAVCKFHQRLCESGNVRVMDVLLRAVSYYT